MRTRKGGKKGEKLKQKRLRRWRKKKRALIISFSSPLPATHLLAEERVAIRLEARALNNRALLGEGNDL